MTYLNIVKASFKKEQFLICYTAQYNPGTQSKANCFATGSCMCFDIIQFSMDFMLRMEIKSPSNPLRLRSSQFDQ